jgi:uncharacterized protein
VIAVDTNILVYAQKAHSPWNAKARAALDRLVSSGVEWAIPFHCLVEFFAISTHPRVYKPPSTSTAALTQIDYWLEAPRLTLLSETRATWSVLGALVVSAKIAGPAIYDARIAAVCIEHGVSELWSSDRDFSRFPSLRVVNPLVDPLPARASESRATYRVPGRRRGRRPANVQSR